MADDLWSKYPDRYAKCGSCDGSGKEKCHHCEGRGMTYSPHMAHDFYVHSPKLRFGYIRCRPCEGRGEVDCFRCNGDGSIASNRNSEPLSSEERLKSDHQGTAESLEALKREFNEKKEKALDRILKCREWSSDYRWKLRDQVRAIEIESPSATLDLLRLSKPMTDTYETSDHDVRTLTHLMERLELIASCYSDRAETRSSLLARMPPVDLPKPLGVESAKPEAKPKDHCTRCRRSNLQVHNGRLWCSFCEDWAAT